MQENELEEDSNVSWRRRLLKKQPRRNVLFLKQPFRWNRNPFPKNWTFHRRSEIRKEPINLCWWNLKPVARQATPPIWITRHRAFPFRLLYKRSRKFSRTSLTATTILVTHEFVLTVTVNQKKVPNSSGAPAVTSPDILALSVNGRTGDFTNLRALLLSKELQQRLSYVDLRFSGLVEGYFIFFSYWCCDTVYIYSGILTLV